VAAFRSLPGLRFALKRQVCLEAIPQRTAVMTSIFLELTLLA